mgnify:CR=1 FL=1
MLDALRTYGATPIVLDKPRTYHLANWNRLPDGARLRFLRSVASQRARDPRIRKLVAEILAESDVEQRQYPEMAAVLLRWVQQNVRYVNEPGEILQDPLYTLWQKQGDCDDLSILYACFCESVALQWRFVLSGHRKADGVKVRWVEQTPQPMGVHWAHIYVCVGWPPFRPSRWAWAEPSVKTAQLGWDVISHMEQTGRADMPELADPWGAAALSPAPGAAGGAAAASAAGMSRVGMLEAVITGTVVGVTTTVLATLALDWLRSRRRTSS